MRRPWLVAVLIIVASAPNWVAAQPDVAVQPTVQQVLAQMPREALLRLPAWALQKALDGEIPAADLVSLAGVAPPVRVDAASPLVQKQFITHWLTHWETLVEGISDDTVGIASIDGRCSGQAIGDGAKAPYVSAFYFANADGTVQTNTSNVPPGPTCGSTINAGLSRYFVPGSTRRASARRGCSSAPRTHIACGSTGRRSSPTRRRERSRSRSTR